MKSFIYLNPQYIKYVSQLILNKLLNENITANRDQEILTHIVIFVGSTYLITYSKKRKAIAKQKPLDIRLCWI